MNHRLHRLRLAALLLALSLPACGGSGTPPNPPPAAPTRAFMMGATPFQTSVTPAGAVVFPDWKFENLDERDLLSLHVDDFWGVPWSYCSASGCSNLPAAWVARWQKLAADAKASGKPVYLALSPLTERKTLATTVQPDGTTRAGWNTATDANGCYRFATDDAAASHQAAYIGYVKYLVDLVGPKYLSPAVEMNIPFTSCPDQKAAWTAWYAEMHNAIAAAYPSLVVFPTFVLEYMYGVVNAQTQCAAGTSYTACFDQRLAEALTVPGARIAFSTYPSAWTYSPAFNHKPPTDTFARVRQATRRRIWIAETGWPAVRLLTSYAHGGVGACGTELLPAVLTVPGSGVFDVANDAAQAAYLSWLLSEAQAQGFEAVVWWLERDYLDGPTATRCPCAPADSATCKIADAFHAVGGDPTELLLRGFGNMGLRNYDGSPRPSAAVWHDWVVRAYRP